MYILLDYYDDWFKGDVIGKFKTLQEARKRAMIYDEDDTDGECDLEIVDDKGTKYCAYGNVPLQFED